MKTDFRNWSDIRVFLAVIREGSTLAASKTLGLAQPTIARRIEALEHEIGLTLFERETRGFRPTEDARRLYPLAEAIEAAADTFAAKTRDMARPRPIRVTAASHFSDRAMDIFTTFSAEHPGVSFEFVHQMALLDLNKGEADIALRTGRSEPDETLICRKIGTETFSFYTGQPYVDAHGLPRSLNDLRGHRFVTFQRDGISDIAHAWLTRQVDPDQIVASFSEYDLLLAAIRSGHGIGIAFNRAVELDDGFIRCSPTIPELDLPVSMLIGRDAYRRPEVKAFTKYFAPRYAAFFRRAE